MTYFELFTSFPTEGSIHRTKLATALSLILFLVLPKIVRSTALKIGYRSLFRTAGYQDKSYFYPYENERPVSCKFYIGKKH